MSYPEPEEPAVFPRPMIDGVKRPRFVIRTIRDGCVRIYGRTYYPPSQHRVYDGRLDGRRYAFGLYNGTSEFVCLWGTEDAYWAVALEPGDYRDAPEVVDGALPWVFWSVDPAASREQREGS